jgi:DNA-3-methyladenine glycosylase
MPFSTLEGAGPLTGKLIKLRRSFYLRPTLTIAKDLIGKLFVRRLNGQLLVGRIVEVEAYLGARDPASHAFKGRTPRNEVMFWRGGHLYVYFTYGMHFCSNIVTEREGIGHAILLRAVEPLQGINLMAQHRERSLETTRDIHELCNGPAKLCEAYAITASQNGADLCEGNLWMAKDNYRVSARNILATTRVGITQGADHRWRYCLRDNPCVSRGKPS